MARRGDALLTRAESSTSGYDLDLNDYSNYKNKLEDDHRRFSLTKETVQYESKAGKEDEDDDEEENFDDTDLQTPSQSQYNQSSTQDAPVVWIKVFDEENQQYYYFNTFSGDSTWEKPADFIEIDDTAEEDEGRGNHTHSQLMSESMNMFSEYPSQAVESHHSDHYDFSWNDINLQQIQQHDWTPPTATAGGGGLGNGDHPPHHHSIDQSQSQYQSQSQIHNEESDENNSLHLSKQTHLMGSAYGTIYQSEHLLIDEIILTQKKFLKMKNDGKLLRELMGWEEWLSSHGALFYIKRGKVQ
jgi:hypothetical protein